ncbi:MAG: universal stress protein [Rubrivivax sp.]|nr:universal stress protein [Rubrivivax sp.]
MYRTALLALDLSPAEAPLLACMPALRRWGVERLVIVHVIRVGYMQGPLWQQHEQTAARLDADAAALRAAGLTVEVQVRSAGVPADEILAAAAETGAGLLVVGSRSHNLAQRLFLGSVARELIRKAARPLLLEWMEPTAEGTAARCEAVCSDPLRHVLLATDLSPQARAAEQAATTLAANAGRLDVLTVLPPAAVQAAPTLPPATASAQQALLAALPDEAVRGEALVEIVDGAPAAAIARRAQSLDASLIVVGRHGQGWLASALIGSTASALCESAGRPVLVVPLPAPG